MPNASNSDARKRLAENQATTVLGVVDDTLGPIYCANCEETEATLARVAALADDLERRSSLMWSSTVAKAIREALDGGA